MPLLVVGSVALDSVETPTERRDDVLGGSAVYFSYAASYFTSVRWSASWEKIFLPSIRPCCKNEALYT